MTPDEIRAAIDAVTWYHTIDLGHGVVTPGIDQTPARMGVLGLPADLTGRSVLDMAHVDVPAMAFYPGTELNHDPTNWCGPNPACVIGMLTTAGFRRAECVYTWLEPVEERRPQARGNAIFHAWK